MAKSVKRLVGSASKKVLGEEKTKALKTLVGYEKPLDQQPPANSTQIPPKYGDNTVVNHPKLEHSKIIFKGKNNILYCEEGLTLINSEILFKGSNGILYLSKNKAGRYHLNVHISHNSAVFIGAETRFNIGKSVDIQASDHKHIIIGEDCLFSWNPWIFTSDGHPIYDNSTKQRINYGRSVLIGDHVWIGQGVTILKGSVVGSGAIIGSNSVLTGKSYNSNSSYVGSPAKEIKKNVFFTKQSINHSDNEKLERTKEYPSDDFIYSYDKNEELTLEEIDKALSDAKTSQEKLAYIKEHLAHNKRKNRFYINNDQTVKE